MLPDKFEFQRELGNGFFGRVVLARDVALDRLRAVKLIDPADVLNQDQLFAEAQVLADLNSPYIVPVYGAGQTEDGEIYIVMEYIESGSIADVMNDGVVPLRTAVSALIDVCRALEAVALKGIVHRDIKPTNILLSAKGQAKLADFGFAVRTDDAGNVRAHGYTPHFAPEALRFGITNHLTDIYATGLTLYRLLNGSEYFSTESWCPELEAKTTQGKFPDRSSYQPFVPKRLRLVTNRAMHPDPSRRYQDAAELRHALEAIPISMDWRVSRDGETAVFESFGDAVSYRGTLVSRANSSSFGLVRRSNSGTQRKMRRQSVTNVSDKAALKACAEALGSLTAA